MAGEICRFQVTFDAIDGNLLIYRLLQRTPIWKRFFGSITSLFPSPKRIFGLRSTKRERERDQINEIKRKKDRRTHKRTPVKKHIAKSILIAGCLAACSYAGTQSAKADVLPAFEPEIASSVWEENAQLKASVTLNGKEITCFKGDASGVSAEQRAENFASRLKQALDDEKFDANKLIPARDGEVASARVDGVTIMKFEGIETESGKSVLEQSCKTVNAIRTALGAQLLPPTFAKIAELANKDVNPSNTKGCFSGHASWYGGKFHGRKTSDGSRFNQDGLTAAHRSLPFGTKLLVMNRKTGQSCVVQVNDRGPFVGDRIIDLSRGAARQLDMLGSGVATVDCLVLGM